MHFIARITFERLPTYNLKLLLWTWKKVWRTCSLNFITFFHLTVFLERFLLFFLTLLPNVVRLSNVFAQTLNKILFCLLWLSTSVCLFIVTQLEKENFLVLRFTKNFSSKKLYRSTFVMRLKIIVHSFAKWNNHKIIIITLKKQLNENDLILINQHFWRGVPASATIKPCFCLKHDPENSR